MDDYKALQIKAQTARAFATLYANRVHDKVGRLFFKLTDEKPPVVTCQSDAIYESQVLDDCAAWIEEIQRAANVALPTIKRLAQELRNAQ